MRKLNKFHFISNNTRHQNGMDRYREPHQYVNVVRPPDVDDARFQVKQAQLPNVQSIEVIEGLEDAAKSFSIVCSNEDGFLSPDYRETRFDTRRLNFEMASGSPWANILKSGTEIHVHFGYFPHFTRFLTGEIDDVTIDAENRTLTISGRSMYGHAHKDTVTPLATEKYLINDPDTDLGTAIEKMLTNVGIKNEIDKNIKEPWTGHTYTVGEKCGVRQEYPNDYLTNWDQFSYYKLVEDSFGVVRNKKLPPFGGKMGKAVATLDDWEELTSAELVQDASDVFDRILVVNTREVTETAENGQKKTKTVREKSRFKSKSIRDQVLISSTREMMIETTWCDTPQKRRLAAKAQMTLMLMKLKAVTVKIMANVQLELLDVVSVRERITQQYKRYFVIGIKTTMDSNGFVQELELCENIKYNEIVEDSIHATPIPPSPPTSTPEGTPVPSEPGEVIATSPTQTCYVRVYDSTQADGDRIKIRINGKTIKSNLLCRNPNDAKYYKFKLAPGKNYIQVVGLSCGKKGSGTARIEFTDENKDPMAVTTFYFNHPLPSPSDFINGKDGYVKKERRKKTTYVLQNNEISIGGG